MSERKFHNLLNTLLNEILNITIIMQKTVKVVSTVLYIKNSTIQKNQEMGI